MSSSQPAEAPLRPRWRSLGTWPLRTRLVAIMIALLCLLGILVGGTAEIFLRKTLYEQIDSKLRDAQARSHFYFDQLSGDYPQHGRPDGGGKGGPPGGIQAKTVMVQLDS